MTYNCPEEIPVSIWPLPLTWKKHGKDMIEIAKRFPHFFPGIDDGFDYRQNMPGTYRVGNYTDEWGCVWSNIEEGMEAIVKEHPVKNREDILTLKIPDRRDGYLHHGFMYLRLLDLRGFEEAMLDFAEECEELQILIDKVTEYCCLQVAEIIKRPRQIAIFGDDLGMQAGMAIGAEKWRKYLKPSYTKIYASVRDAGKYVYMHTDGMVYEIIPDLFETGVQMVNPQFRANGLANLERVCKGYYPINLDLDRQLFPFATPGQIREHVRECVETLYLPSGGLGLDISFGDEVPLENIEALLEAVDKYRFYRG